MPALIAIASSGRPLAAIGAAESSTPSRRREIDLARLDLRAQRLELAGGVRQARVLGGDSRSKPCCANCLASSSPMPLEAPVTTAYCLLESFMSREFPCGTVQATTVALLGGTGTPDGAARHEDGETVH